MRLFHEEMKQDQRNLAADPKNATVLDRMKQKLKQLLAPLRQPLGEFGVWNAPSGEGG